MFKGLTLINTAMGTYGPHFCKGLIDAVWCDNVGSQMHSNSANMLYIHQGIYVVFVVIGFCMIYHSWASLNENLAAEEC